MMAVVRLGNMPVSQQAWGQGSNFGTPKWNAATKNVIGSTCVWQARLSAVRKINGWRIKHLFC